MTFKRKRHLLLVFLLLTTSLIVTTVPEYAVADSNSNCAADWKVDSWWADPVTFSYKATKIGYNQSPNSKYEGPITNGVFAPQLTDEVLSKLESLGKSLEATFYVSRKGDLDYDEKFHLVYNPQTSWSRNNFPLDSKFYSQKEKDKDLVFLHARYPYSFSTFPAAELATKITIDQPGCNSFTTQSTYHKNADYKLAEIQSEAWNSYWTEKVKSYKDLEVVTKWEKDFKEIVPKPLEAASANPSDKFYALMPRNEILGTYNFHFDWNSCPQVHTTTSYEKDIYPKKGILFTMYEMRFNEFIYGDWTGTPGIYIDKSEKETSCQVNVYFYESEYGRFDNVIFFLGVKKFIIPATESKAASELRAKQEADAKAAAELKAKQEADAKAAADKAAGEKIIADAKAEAARILAAAKAASVKKKTTITCIKGKLTKKVTAVKPACPKGYKQK
jgi:hypothetical protein